MIHSRLRQQSCDPEAGFFEERRQPMPLKINVGLSRKVADQSYGSKGASINIEMELDGSLANDPAKLQGRIRQLFGLVRDSVTEELNGSGTNDAEKKSPPATKTAAVNQGNGHNGNASSSAKSARQATESQVKAIYAITKIKGLNLTSLLRDHFQVDHPQKLSLKQASAFIDQLKNGGSA
jgi:hypothetical protein